jgi:Asp-tRNA(Asn)/Glu-tRNA(Gln) amidotransferase A subunit family amidase
LYGIKATHARISGFGAREYYTYIDSIALWVLSDGCVIAEHLAPTVGISGPIAASADDMTLAYAIVAGKDPKDQATLMQPPVSIATYTDTKSLEGLKIGIFSGWNNFVMDPIITERIEVFKKHFESLGATFVEITIPELEDARKGI